MVYYVRPIDTLFRTIFLSQYVGQNSFDNKIQVLLYSIWQFFPALHLFKALRLFISKKNLGVTFIPYPTFIQHLPECLEEPYVMD